MANDITGPVWRIDTLPFSYIGPVRMTNVVWTDQGAVGDSFIMQSQPGKTLIDTKAYAVNYVEEFKNIAWVPTNPPGIKITALTSGIVTIYVGAGK